MDVSRDVRLRFEGGTMVPLVSEHGPAMADAVTESASVLRETVPWYRDGMTAADFVQWAEVATGMWAESRAFVFSVIADDTGQLLGGASLEGVSAQTLSANLSYWVRSTASSRGVATRCARRLSAWGCVDVGLQRVEISMVTSNVASVAVARRAGAVFEGTLRNAARWGGLSRDMAVFSVVPSDIDDD